MTFIEFIGLIISLLALAIISARQAREERKRRQNPELYEREQEGRRRSLQETLREMHIEVENGPETEDVNDVRDEELEVNEVPVRAPPPRPPTRMAPTRMVQRSYEMPFRLKRFQQVRPIDQRRLTSPLQLRRIGRDVLSRDMATDGSVDAYSQKRSIRSSEANRLIRDLKRPSEMVLLHTIWGLPKGMQ